MRNLKGSFENPDGSYYSAENQTYVDSEGRGMSMRPEKAAELRQEEAVDVEVRAKVAAKEREVGGAEAQVETGRGLVGLETAQNLKELREKIGEKNFEIVIEVLKGKKLKGEIESKQLGEGFVFLGIEEAFQGLVKEQLTKEDTKKLKPVFATFFEFKDAEFPDLLAKLGAASMLVEFKNVIKKKYEYLFSFKPFTSGDFNLTYVADFSEGKMDLEVSLPSGVQEQYKKHKAVEDKKAEVAEAQADAKDKAAEATQTAEATRKEQIEKLKEHSIGAIIVSFFGAKGPGGEESLLDKLLGGKAPILAFFLGALGVPTFAKGYTEAKELAGKYPKLAKIFDQIEAKAKTFRTEVPKEKEKPAKKIGSRELKELVIGGGVVPEQGIELGRDYKFGIRGHLKTLSVNLSKGGKMVLPAGKGARLKINGERPKIRKDQPREYDTKDAGEDGVFVLTGVIPKGTVFTGKVRFPTADF